MRHHILTPSTALCIYASTFKHIYLCLSHLHLTPKKKTNEKSRGRPERTVTFLFVPFLRKQKTHSSSHTTNFFLDGQSTHRCREKTKKSFGSYGKRKSARKPLNFTGRGEKSVSIFFTHTPSIYLCSPNAVPKQTGTPRPVLSQQPRLDPFLSL